MCTYHSSSRLMDKEDSTNDVWRQSFRCSASYALEYSGREKTIITLGCSTPEGKDGQQKQRNEDDDSAPIFVRKWDEPEVCCTLHQGLNLNRIHQPQFMLAESMGYTPQSKESGHQTSASPSEDHVREIQQRP